MTIPFLNLSLLNVFRRKSKEEAIDGPAPKAAMVVEKPSSERLSKTVLPSASRAVALQDPFRVGGKFNPITSGGESFAGAPPIVSFSAPALGLQTPDLPPALAFALEPKVERVIYPHHPSHPQYELAKRQMTRGSTLLAIEVKGGQQAAFTFSDSLAVILISNNLGDAKSLITHPRTTTHARLTEEVRLETGVTPGLLRLSVGLESSDDLIADLMYGLDQV